MIFVYLLMALIGVAATLFVVQNPDPVAVSFLVWQTASMPLSLVILLSAFVGIVFAAVTGFSQQIQLRLKIRQLEHRIAQLSATKTPVTAERVRMEPPPPAPAPLPASAPSTSERMAAERERRL
jgi:uncharacterized integral membrane protein